VQRQLTRLLTGKVVTVAEWNVVSPPIGRTPMFLWKPGDASPDAWRLSLADNLVCPVLADPSQLRRVFYNLIDNAIRYTPATGRVAAEATTIEVSDTGSGIPPEHLPRIFDRFSRVDPSRTEDGDGAGLGLAICQSIIRSYGGTISVESTVGRGTTFTVQLPRESSATA
jgi:signal transduction histidine kinase